jgi:phosphoserine phosphatase RsbU/P
VTRTGTEAWETFDRAPVRVVVSDWMMPGMDGLEFCHRVRTRPNTPYTYFILLTALGTSAENYVLATAAGIDDFLPKPLDPIAIRMRLRVAHRILRFTREVHQLKQLIPICAYCHKYTQQRIIGSASKSTSSNRRDRTSATVFARSVLKPKWRN